MEKKLSPSPSPSPTPPAYPDVDHEKAQKRAAVDIDVDAFDQAAGSGNADEHINYRSMGWIKAGALIMAEVRILPLFFLFCLCSRLSSVIISHDGATDISWYI